MDSTTKTVLIVGAAAVAAFVLLRMFAPQPMPTSARGAGAGLSIRGIAGLGSSLLDAGKKLFADAPVTSYPADIDGVSTDEFKAGHFGVSYQ